MLGEKCIVKHCPNHSKEGEGIFIEGMYTFQTDKNKIREPDIENTFICKPCWNTITGQLPDKHSVGRINKAYFEG